MYSAKAHPAITPRARRGISNSCPPTFCWTWSKFCVELIIHREYTPCHGRREGDALDHITRAISFAIDRKYICVPYPKWFMNLQNGVRPWTMMIRREKNLIENILKTDEVYQGFSPLDDAEVLTLDHANRFVWFKFMWKILKNVREIDCYMKGRWCHLKWYWFLWFIHSFG